MCFHLQMIIYTGPIYLLCLNTNKNNRQVDHYLKQFRAATNDTWFHLIVFSPNLVQI